MGDSSSSCSPIPVWHSRSIRLMSYLLPPDEHALTGACAYAGGLCTWSGRAGYRWTPDMGWTALDPAPTSIDSGFELHSGVLAGAHTHVGFLPNDGTGWAWWADLSEYANAHPMYGDLLLCTKEETDDTTYHLFSISTGGLTPHAQFGADELAGPVAGWSSPTNAERLLLLGEGGLWALGPPHTEEALQHLVSFDDVELPLLEDIPGPFQPGVATVVIPRRTRTALRLDLSDGSGHATGIKHLPGDAALWTTYLRDDRATATHLLSALVDLPSPPDDALSLHDVLVDEGTVQAIATSAGLCVPEAGTPPARPDATAVTEALPDAALDPAALATWALWLDGDDALATACRVLCNAEAPDYPLVESLRSVAGADACAALFDLLASTAPPAGPADDHNYQYPHAALRALAAPFQDDVAALVADRLAAAEVPVRAAASAMAGALPADADPSAPGPSGSEQPALWGTEHALPVEELRANAHHDHPAVRTAARDTCTRLDIDWGSSTYARRSAQSSQPESPK